MAACLVGLALGAGLVACGGGAVDATPAAEAMAEALASGEFEDVPLANATPGDVASVVEEMTSGIGVSSRTVDLLDLDRSRDDDARAATFEVTWDLQDIDDDWVYTTTASLSFTGEAWLVDWTAVGGTRKQNGGAPASELKELRSRVQAAAASGDRVTGELVGQWFGVSARTGRRRLAMLLDSDLTLTR